LYGPHLKSAVLLCVDAQDCVLDGEVLLYNVEKQSFEHFDQVCFALCNDVTLSLNAGIDKALCFQRYRIGRKFFYHFYDIRCFICGSGISTNCFKMYILLI